MITDYMILFNQLQLIKIIDTIYSKLSAVNALTRSIPPLLHAMRR